jgi:signal transduction histidine kinase
MFLYQVNRYSVDEKLEALRSNCAVVSDLTENYLQNPTPVNERLYVNTLMYLASLSDYRIAVASASGRVIASADGDSFSTDDGVISQAITEQIIRDGEGYFTDTLGNYYPYSMFTVGLPVKNRLDGVSAIVFVSTSGENLYSLYFDIFRLITLSALLVFAVGIIFTLFVVRATAYPLHQMGDAARSYARGDFSARVKVKGKNEISELAETFNNMAASLEEYDKTRQDFLANIAHELRTPMTTVAGYIDGILDGTIPKEKEPEYLQVITEEVRRLSRLISSILYLSRMQSDKEPLVRSDINICELTGRVMLGFEHEVAKKNVTVDAEFADYDIMVNADPDAIMRVVYNLFGNAVKFTNEGGTITVRIARRGHKAEVSIRNTGEGIAKEDLPYIFDRFFKGDKSRGIDMTGTGLGLSICKSILGMHGEEIYAASVEGEYAAFSFTLPLSRKMIEG